MMIAAAHAIAGFVSEKEQNPYYIIPAAFGKRVG
jgi:malic enzyme